MRSMGTSATRDERSRAGDLLTYGGRFTAGDFVIESDLALLGCMVKRRTGNSRPNGEFTGFDVGVFPVFLDIRIFNPGREKLVIHKAEMVVEESVPDFEPILGLA